MTRHTFLLIITFFLCVLNSNGQSISPNTTQSICVGDSLRLNIISLDNAKSYSFKWYKNNVPITDSTRSSLVIKQTGDYIAEYTENGNSTKLVSIKISVNSKPTANFKFPLLNECGEKTIKFENTSLDSNGRKNLIYNWDFGNEKISNDSTPTTTFQPGTSMNGSTFNIKLKVKNTNGCSDSITKQISIRQSPKSLLFGDNASNFNGQPYFKFCQSEAGTFKFKNSSTTISSNTSYKIKWGDNTQDAILSSFPADSVISHTYPVGIRPLVFYTYSGVCVDSAKYNIFIGNKPAGGIGAPEGRNICAGDSIPFFITSASANPPGTRYIFSVNDLSIEDTFYHPAPDVVKHTFKSSSCGFSQLTSFPNTFQATLNISNPCNIQGTQGTITPIEVSDRPTSEITKSQKDTFCVGQNMIFSNIGNPGNNVQDGVCTPGKSIWNISPSVGWTLPFLQTLGATNGFLNPSDWTSGSNNVQVTFTDPGIYEIKLLMANNTLCGADSVRTKVCVNPIPAPTLSFNNSSICIGSSIFPIATLNKPTCGNYTYSWSIQYVATPGCFPNTSSYKIINENTLNPSIEFNNPGLYTVKLSVTAPGGACTTEISKPILVRGKPTIVLPTFTALCQIENLSPNATVNCTDSVTSYAWTFQNGKPATSKSISPGVVSFTTSGTQQIILEATNSCGVTLQTTDVIVKAMPIVQDITGPSTICKGSQATLSGPTGGTWSSSNTTIASISSAGIITGNQEGSVEISYTVVINACSNVVKKVITINPQPGISTQSIPDICNTSTSFNIPFTTLTNGASTYDLIGAGTNPIPGFTNIINGVIGTSPINANIAGLSLTQNNYGFNLVVKNTNGCSSPVVNINLKVFAPPSISNAGPDQLQCNNGNFNLQAITPAVGSGSWELLSGSLSILSPASATSKVSGLASGSTATLKWKVGNNPCPASTDEVVIQNIKSVTSPNISGNLSNCNNDTFAITGSAPEVGQTGLWELVSGTAKLPTDLTKSVLNITGIPAGTNAIFRWKLSNSICNSFKDATISNRSPIINNTIGPDQTSCGELISILGSDPAGGGIGSLTPFYKYEWQFKIAGENWTTIQSPIGSSKDLKNYSINQSMTFRRLVFDSNCTNTSNLSKVDLQASITNNSISGSKILCSYEDPQELIGSLPNGGGSNDYVYEWQVNKGEGVWIKVGNTINYDPPSHKVPSNEPVIHTYRRIVNSPNCPNSLPLTSNSITIKWNPNATAEFNALTLSQCAPFGISLANNIKLTSYPTRNAQYNWRFIQNDGSGKILLSLDNSSTPPAYVINLPNNSVALQLIAIGANGCKNDTTQQIFTTNDNPIVSFLGDFTNSCSPKEIQITNNSYLGTSGNNQGLSYQWFVNDKLQSALFNPILSLSNSSNILDAKVEVKLIASIQGSSSCKDSSSVTFDVLPSPLSKFTIVSSDDCSKIGGVTKTVLNSSIAKLDKINYKWKAMYANGKEAFSVFISDTTAKSPTFTFPHNESNADTTYTISLEVFSTDNCSMISTENIKIFRKPVVKFNLSKLSGCGPFVVNVLDSTTNVLHSKLWTYTSNVTNAPEIVFSNSTSINPLISIPENRLDTTIIYSFRQIATSVSGCKDTLKKEILVFPKPKVNFSVPSLEGCTPYSFQATSTSVAGNSEDFSSLIHQWKVMKDNKVLSIGNSSNLPLMLTNTGFVDSTYTISLYVTTKNGCADSVTKTVTVRGNAKASYQTKNSEGCIPFNIKNEIQLNAFDGVNSNYVWNLNGAPFSTGINPPNFIIKKDGDTIIVKLEAISSYGCLNDFYVDTFTTAKTPIPSFTKSTDRGCSPLIVTFNNNSIAQGSVNYLWNFGNGIISQQIQPNQISYLASPEFKDSIYNVTLIANTTCGAVIFKDSIIVRPKPKAIVAPDSTRLCSPVIVNFNNFSKGANKEGGGITYLWNFGDGMYDTTNTNQLVKHKYYNKKPISDTFTMKVIALNECGIDSNNYKIIVLPNDVVAELVIDGNEKIVCPPYTVKLFNKSVGATSFKWDLGDGTMSSTNVSPDEKLYTFTKPGNYIISLFATNGCSDSTTYETLTVLDPVTASFTTDKKTYCDYDSIKFINTASIAANSFEWDFGDGNKSFSKNPIHKYLDSGSYKVSLIARNIGTGGTFCENIFTKEINIGKVPNSKIKLNESLQQCTPFNLIAQVDSQSAPIIIWTFEDGINTDSVYNSFVAQHIYKKGGIFRIGLAVTSAKGCTDSSFTEVQIQGSPVSNFSASDSIVCVNQIGNKSIIITNLTQVPNGQTHSYQWLVDGIIKSNDKKFYNHDFKINSLIELPKIFVITLRTISSNGCITDSSMKVNFVPYPKAKITVSSTINCYDDQVYLTDNDNLLSHKRVWSVRGLGTEPSATIANDTARQTGLNIPINNSLSIYRYEIKLTVTSSGICSDSILDTIQIYPKPQVFFNFPDTVCSAFQQLVINKSIPFAGTSINNMQFRWTLKRYNAAGDTVTVLSSNDLDLVFKTSNVGSSDSTYFLSLSGKTAEGCVAIFTKRFVVRAPVLAAFTYTPIVGCRPANLVITKNDSRNAAYFKWYINDTLISTAFKPNDTVLTRGGATYKIKLLAISQVGCKSDSVENKLETYEPPIAKINVSDTVSCTGELNALFTDLSLGFGTDIEKWNWNFGDGTTSNLKNPNKYYAKSGQYETSLTVFDKRGCYSEIVKANIIIYGKPKAAFTVGNICIGDSIITTNKSILGYGSTSFTNYRWDFGDGNSSLSFEPRHAYKLAGEYTIRLIVYSNNSCIPDTVSKKVTVIGKPEAALKWDIQCWQSAIQFTSTSIDGFSDNIRSYNWEWSDGIISTKKDPVKIFSDAGLFKVKLIVTGSLCPALVDSVEKIIKIYKQRPALIYPRQNVALQKPHQLFAEPSGLIYFWQPTLGLDNPNIKNPIVQYQLPKPQKVFYTIEITDSAGCKIYDKQEVWVFEQTDIYLPTAFTPNGDGINEVFRPLYVNINSIKYFKLFDRRGNLLLQTSDMNYEWNGTIKGKNYPMDTYTWIILAVDKDGQELFRKGNVTLIRKE